jgi:hyperosmotically inducible periplasmic protein
MIFKNIARIIIISSCFFCTIVNANSVTDDLITNEVKSLLNKEADIPTKKLNISTKDGVILLNGTVETRLQADKIVEVANSVDNVKDVDTYKLKVVSSHQYLTDAFITSSVKGKLTWLIRHNKIGKHSRFHVETTNGNVHIFGKVEDNQDISIITREVGRIKGVKQVRCNIDN